MTAPRPLPRPGQRPPMPAPKLLTVAEVAGVMRVSGMTVYRLIRRQELRSVRIGRSLRVPERAVHDYLRDAEVGRDA